MISWIGWLDSYENLSLFFVIMFLPASKKHSNHIIPKSPTIFFKATNFRIQGTQLLLLQWVPLHLPGSSCSPTCLQLWRRWAPRWSYGASGYSMVPWNAPEGSLIWNLRIHTQTKKTIHHFQVLFIFDIFGGVHNDDHIWYVNSLALRATGTLHPLSLSAVWSQWTFPKKNP